jgi:hypothetical protein
MVQFADNNGGSYLQSLMNNYQIRSEIQNRTAVVVPGEPTLSVQKAQPVESAVTSPAATEPPAASGASTATATTSPMQTKSPRTTETSP